MRETGVPRTPSSLAAIAPDGLRQLEFEKVLEEVARRAIGPLGGERVRRRLPLADLEAVQHELDGVDELQRLLARGDDFRPEPVADVGPLLARVAIEGAVAEGPELVAIGRALEAMRLVGAQLDRLREEAPRLATLRVELPPARLGRELLRTLDGDGLVRDGTDDRVDRARRAVREVRGRLVDTLERLLRDLGSHEVPPDAAVTVRHGRYVVPVLRDARGRVPGIIHAESASGATLFVEPQSAVEQGNALATAEADEARAVHAVFRRLSEAVRVHVPAARAGLEMCVRVDDRYARARYAADLGGVLPRMVAAPEAHVLRNARHPLLLAEAAPTVPFDLALSPQERALVVSGPNTGGKTVLLKAVGVMSALAQAGIIPPVGDGSTLPVYRAFVIDIGDNQSIAASLSTFSAHLHALRSALELAGPATLVLLDEVGAGTDPVEGAALAAATLETLVTAGSRVVATTHLGELKQLASDNPEVVNASLRFDAATLTPTYELVKGIPGRSYGVVIARRLGLPPEVIARAEGRTPQGDRSLDAMLADVEERSATVRAQEAQLGAMAERVRRLEGELAARRERLEEREREVAQRAGQLEREGREQTRRFLLEARKRVEEALGLARAAVTEATAKEARRLVEEGITEEGAALKRLQDALAEKGWRVTGSGERGAVPSKSLRPSGARRRAPEPRVGSEGTAPRSPLPVSEVDLRGMDAEDARAAVDRAVDAAVLADLPAVRIIHGKGMGVLRAVVDEVLRQDPRVASHRLAPPREGGTGVTIAELG